MACSDWFPRIRKCALACGLSSRPNTASTDSTKFRPEANGACTGAVLLSFVLVAVEFHLKRLTHVRRGSLQLYGSPLR